MSSSPTCSDATAYQKFDDKDEQKGKTPSNSNHSTIAATTTTTTTTTTQAPSSAFDHAAPSLPAGPRSVSFAVGALLATKKQHTAHTTTNFNAAAAASELLGARPAHGDSSADPLDPTANAAGATTLNSLAAEMQVMSDDPKSCSGIYLLSSMWCALFYVLLLLSSLFLRQTVHIVILAIAVAKPCVRKIRGRGLTNTMPQTIAVWLCAAFSLPLLLALISVAIMALSGGDGLQRARDAAYILGPLGVFNPVDHPAMCSLGVIVNVAVLLLCALYHKFLSEGASLGEKPEVAKRRRLHERVYLIRVCLGLAVAAFTRPSLLTVVFYLLHIIVLVSFCVKRTVTAKWRVLQATFIFTSTYTAGYMLVFLAIQNEMFKSFFPDSKNRDGDAVPMVWGLTYRNFETVLRGEFLLGVFYAVHVLAIFDVMHTSRRIHGRYALLRKEEADAYVHDRILERVAEIKERARKKAKGAQSVATAFLNAFIDAFPILMLPGLVIVVNLIQNVPAFGVLLVTIFGFVAPLFVFVPALPYLYIVCSLVIAYAFVSEVLGGVAADWMALYLFRDRDYNRGINMLSLSVLAFCCTCWVFVFSLKRKLASSRASKSMSAMMASKRQRLERALDVVEDRLHPLAVQFKSLCDPGTQSITRAGFPALIHVVYGVEPTAAEVERLWNVLVLQSEEHQHQEKVKEKLMQHKKVLAAVEQVRSTANFASMANMGAGAGGGGAGNANEAVLQQQQSFAKALAFMSAGDEDDDEDEDESVFLANVAAAASSAAASAALSVERDEHGGGAGAASATPQGDFSASPPISARSRTQSTFQQILLARASAAQQQRQLQQQEKIRSKKTELGAFGRDETPSSNNNNKSNNNNNNVTTAEKSDKSSAPVRSGAPEKRSETPQRTGGRKRSSSASASSRPDPSSASSTATAAAAAAASAPTDQQALAIGATVAKSLRNWSYRARNVTISAADAARQALADGVETITTGNAPPTSSSSSSRAASVSASSSAAPSPDRDKRAGKPDEATTAAATSSLAAELLQDEENLLYTMTSRTRLASIFSNLSVNSNYDEQHQESQQQDGAGGDNYNNNNSGYSDSSLHREESMMVARPLPQDGLPSATAEPAPPSQTTAVTTGTAFPSPAASLPPPGLRFSGFLELHSEVGRYRMWESNVFFVLVALFRDLVARNTESFSLLIMFAAASYRSDLDCIRMFYVLIFVAFLCFPTIRQNYWWFLVAYNILVIVVLYAYSLVFQRGSPEYVGLIPAELLGLRVLANPADLYINFVLLAVAMLQYRTRVNSVPASSNAAAAAPPPAPPPSPGDKASSQQQVSGSDVEDEKNNNSNMNNDNSNKNKNTPLGGDITLRQLLSDMEWTRIGRTAATKTVKARVALLITVVCFMVVVAIEDQSALVAIFAALFVSRLRAQISNSCLASPLGFFSSLYSVLALIAVALYQFESVREWFTLQMQAFFLCAQSPPPVPPFTDRATKCAADLGFTSALAYKRSATVTLLPWFVASTTNIVLFTLEKEAAEEREKGGAAAGGSSTPATGSNESAEDVVIATRDSAWLSRPVHLMFAFLAFVNRFSQFGRIWLSHHGAKIVWVSLFIAGVRYRSVCNVMYIILLALDRRGWTCIVLAGIHLCVVYVYPLFFVPEVPYLGADVREGWERFLGFPKKAQQGTLGSPVLVIVCSLIYLQAKKQAQVLRPSLPKQGMVFFANDKTSLRVEREATRDEKGQLLLNEAAASVARFEWPEGALDASAETATTSKVGFRATYRSFLAAVTPGASSSSSAHSSASFLRRRRTMSSFVAPATSQLESDANGLAKPMLQCRSNLHPKSRAADDDGPCAGGEEMKSLLSSPLAASNKTASSGSDKSKSKASSSSSAKNNSTAADSLGYSRFEEEEGSSSRNSKNQVESGSTKQQQQQQQQPPAADVNEELRIQEAIQQKRTELRLLFPLEGSMMLPRNVLQHFVQLQYIVRRFYFAVFGFETMILLLLIGIAATSRQITAVVFFVNVVALWREGRHGVLTDVVWPFRCHTLCILLLLAYTMLNVGVPPQFVDAPPMRGSPSCDAEKGVNWWTYIGCNVPFVDEVFLFFAVVLLRLAYLGSEVRRTLVDRRVNGYRTLGEFFLDREQEVADLRSGARNDAEAVLPPLGHDVLMQPRTLPETLVSVYFGFFPTAILAFFHGALQTSVVSISEMLLGLCLIVYATDIYWTFYRYWGKVTGLLLALLSVQLLANLPPVFAWAEVYDKVAFSIGVAPWTFERVTTFSIVLQIAVVWSAFVQDRIFNEFFFAWKLQSLHKGSILAYRRHQQLMVHMEQKSRDQEMLAATKEAQLVEKLEKIRAQRFGTNKSALEASNDNSSSNNNTNNSSGGGEQRQQLQRKKRRPGIDTSSSGEDEHNEDEEGVNVDASQAPSRHRNNNNFNNNNNNNNRRTIVFQATQSAAREALLQENNNDFGVVASSKQGREEDESKHVQHPENAHAPAGTTLAEKWASFRATVEAKFTEYALSAIDVLSEHSYTGRRPALHYHITTRLLMSVYKFLVRRTGDICVLAFAINFAESGSVADMLLCCSGVIHALVVLPWSSEAYWEYALIYVVFSILIKSTIKIAAENLQDTMSTQAKTAISVLFLDLGVVVGAPPVETAALIDIVFDFFVFGCILVHRRLCVQNGVYVAGGERQSQQEAEEQLQKQLEEENRKLIEGGAGAGGATASSSPPSPSSPSPELKQIAATDDSTKKSSTAVVVAIPLADKLDKGDGNQNGRKRSPLPNDRGRKDDNNSADDDEEEEEGEPQSMAQLAERRNSSSAADDSITDGDKKSNNNDNNNNKEQQLQHQQAHGNGIFSRCWRNAARVATRSWRSVNRFVVEMNGNISKRSGSGRDLYMSYLAVDFLVLIYVTFGYYSLIGTVRGSFLEGLQQNLLPGPLVLTMLALVFSMIVDRIIYVLGSMRAKFIFHAFQTITIHIMYASWKVWVDSPHIGSGVTLFFIKFAYLYVCCAQIRFGFAAHRRHDPFTEQATIWYWLGHEVYRAVPFLFELRVLLDWSFARTALRLKAWWFIEDVHYWIYGRFTDIDDDRTTNPKRGSSFPKSAKVLHGMSLFTGIVFILFFPLMYYSTFNPNLIPNRVVTLSARISLSQVTGIFEGTELGYLDDRADEFKRVLGQTRPSLLPYLHVDDNSRTTQLIDLSSCSSNLWSVSPYTRQQLLNRMENGVRTLTTLRLKNSITNAVEKLASSREDAAAAAAAASAASSSIGSNSNTTTTAKTGTTPTAMVQEDSSSSAYIARQATELEKITSFPGVFFLDMNLRVVRIGSVGALTNDVTLQRRVALPGASLRRLYNIVSGTSRYGKNETELPAVAKQIILDNRNISYGVPMDEDRTVWVPAAWDPFLLNRPGGVALFSETGEVKMKQNMMGCLLMNYNFGRTQRGQAPASPSGQQPNPANNNNNSSTGGNNATIVATTLPPSNGDGGAGFSLADIFSQESWCLRCEAIFKHDAITPDNGTNYVCPVAKKASVVGTLAASTAGFFGGGGADASSSGSSSGDGGGGGGNLINAPCDFEASPAVNSSYPGMYFVAISEPIPSEGGFLPNVGIIALYTTFILTLFTIMRRKFTTSSHRVVLEEVADPRAVAEIVSYIYLTRSVGGENDLTLEELLYFELLDLIRSPESLLKLTGRRVQDYDPVTNEYVRSIEVNF